MPTPIRSIVLLLAVSLFLGAAELPPQVKQARCQELTERAVELEKAGSYKRAGGVYQRAARLCADRREVAHLKLQAAHCYLLAGRLSRSLDLYEELFSKFQLYIPYDEVTAQLRQLAECNELGRGTFLGFKDPDTACKIYRMIILETPSVHVTMADRLKLAELLEADGRPEEAANVYLEAIKKSPNDASLRLKLAMLLLRLSQRGQGDSDGSQLRGAIREAKAFLRLADEDDEKGRAMAATILDQAAEGMAARLLDQARFYLRRRFYRPEAARRYAKEIVEQYPDTAAAAQARVMLEWDLPEKPSKDGK